MSSKPLAEAESRVEKLVSTFEKNATEEIRVQLREYHGHQLLDLRVFYYPEEGGEPRPTKKGISVSVALVPKLREAVEQAARLLEDEKPADAPATPQGERPESS